MSASALESPRPLPAWAAGLAAVAALAASVLAALVLGPGGGRLALGVESVQASSADLIGAAAAYLPLGYAFAAGMVAAVNPCGFALLPAYLGLYLGDRDSGSVGRALRVSLTISATFIAVCGTAGLVLTTVSASLGPLFPWVGLLVGLLLILAGAWLLAGGDLYTSLPMQLAGRLGPTARRGGLAGYAAYGTAFALCSLGCTLPIFLSVVGTSLAGGRFLSVLAQFTLYGLGMGLVVGALTLAVALARRAAFSRLRRLSGRLAPLAAVLLLVTGAYLVFYWLAPGGLLQTLIR